MSGFITEICGESGTGKSALAHQCMIRTLYHLNFYSPEFNGMPNVYAYYIGM